ncbi:MAG: SsrA-binding protein SmpB [SAR202 cluster bacterium]|nr:SsrA-binding protein SmpB [SAR202 cluster bacterium]|tara:strand:+ start:29369 stop:29824 length:456 start_codon:yes stop_codon:yes gene_type:complete
MHKSKIIATNRKASFEYFLTDSYEAGIVLLGTEIKAIREGKVNLTESYVSAHKNEIWLNNCHIGPYSAASINNHDSIRPKKLLLHKDQIIKLSSTTKGSGYTLIAVKMYLKSHRVKLQIAVAKGKKLHDKRRSIKEKEQTREMRRQILKNI